MEAKKLLFPFTFFYLSPSCFSHWGRKIQNRAPALASPAWATSTGLLNDIAAHVLSVGNHAFLSNTQVKRHLLLQSSNPRRIRSFRTLPNDKWAHHSSLSLPSPQSHWYLAHLSSYFFQPHHSDSPLPLFFTITKLLAVFKTHLLLPTPLLLFISLGAQPYACF